MFPAVVAGVDRLIIGVVEEEVKPSTDKTAERMAVKAAREEEKAASRALKQEERAAARAHRDAARAAARADKEAGRSAPRTGGPLSVLRMRRAASGPDIGALVDREMADGSGEASSPDREPILGSASPSLTASPDPRPPPPPATALQHRRSRSQALPELPVSDGEVETGPFRHTANGVSPVGSSPLRSSPLRIGQRTPDTNGHAMRSPFAQGCVLGALFCVLQSHTTIILMLDEQQSAGVVCADDLALPRTPQQNSPAEWPAVARISGLDIEQHTFSADVAYSQVHIPLFISPFQCEWLGADELTAAHATGDSCVARWLRNIICGLAGDKNRA